MPRFHRLSWAVYLVCAGLSTVAAPTWLAASDPAEICDTAAMKAAHETGVPLEALRSLSNTSSANDGVNPLRPWPWTVNLEGHGVWFDTANQAQAYVFRHFRNGARHFDVGCFQINYERHGAAFSTVEDMFNPSKNANFAAGYLKRLHAELGSWERAVGAYQAQSRSQTLENPLHLRENLSSTSSEQGFDPQGRATANAHSVQNPGQRHIQYGSLVPLARQSSSGALIGPDGS